MRSPNQSTITNTIGNQNSFIDSVIALGNNVQGDLIINERPHDVSDLNAYNPYLGLQAYTYAERELYAGREPEIKQAIRYLTTPGEQNTVLFVTGASGSGKSSFVQAGVLPALEQHYTHKTVRYFLIRPSRYPIAQLADALERCDYTPPKHLTVSSWQNLLQTTPAQQITVLIIDQFEELFTQTVEPADRQLLIDLLLNMPDFRHSRTHILATIRADYLHVMLDESKPLYERATEGIPLGAMDEQHLRDAIQQPLRWFQSKYPKIKHKAFELTLLDQLIADTTRFNQQRENRDAYLPLLQVTLEDLWNRGSLTRGAYRSLTDALQTRAHTLYGCDEHKNVIERSPAQQAELMNLLLDLVDVSLDDDARRDVRRRRTSDELAPTPERRQLVQELVNARLLSTTSEKRNNQEVQVVDIIHESLLRNWSDLADAIQRERTTLQRRQRFEDALAEWNSNNQDAQYLLTGVRLAEAEALALASNTATRNQQAQAFIQQSRLAQDAEQAEKLRQAQDAAEAQRQRAETQTRLTKRTRRFLVATLALFVLSLGATGFAVNRQQVAQTEADSRATAESIAVEQKNIAEQNAQQLQQQLDISESQRLVVNAQNIPFPDQNFEIILLLEYEAAKKHDSNLIYEELYQTFMHYYPFYGESLIGHTKKVWRAVFSPDGSQVLTASFDHTAKLWQKDGTLITTLSGHKSAVVSAVFSPDGSQILTASNDGTAKLWQKDGTLITTLSGHTDMIESAVFSPDGSQILTGSWDTTAKLWQKDGTLITTLSGHESAVVSAMFSPDGSEILPALDGMFITTAGILSAVFNHDGSQILTASADSTAKLYRFPSTEDLLNIIACRLTRGLTEEEKIQFNIPNPAFKFEERQCPPKFSWQK